MAVIPRGTMGVVDEQVTHPDERRSEIPPRPLVKRVVSEGQVEELMARVRRQYGIPEDEPVLSSERL